MRLLPLQGMSVGEGDLYSCFDENCYNAVMTYLNTSDDPTEYFSDPESIKQALSILVHSPESHVYYDPNLNSEWDIMGEYGEFCMELEVFGDENGLDCGLDTRTIINSHQGSAGF